MGGQYKWTKKFGEPCPTCGEAKVKEDGVEDWDATYESEICCYNCGTIFNEDKWYLWIQILAVEHERNANVS